MDNQKKYIYTLNSMIKQFIKINIASPKTILSWSERLLPNNELVGEITKPM